MNTIEGSRLKSRIGQMFARILHFTFRWLFTVKKVKITRTKYAALFRLVRTEFIRSLCLRSSYLSTYSFDAPLQTFCCSCRVRLDRWSAKNKILKHRTCTSPVKLHLKKKSDNKHTNNEITKPWQKNITRKSKRGTPARSQRARRAVDLFANSLRISEPAWCKPA